MNRRTTEPTVDEHGDETHPSWAMIRVSRATIMGGSAHLFDSEVEHQHVITVTIEGARRQRDLNRDWIMGDNRPKLELAMSEAQWGAFVSSFGTSGVPATLTYDGDADEPFVPQAPHAPRMALSIDETANAADRAFDGIVQAVNEVTDAFDRKAGRREMGEALRLLRSAVNNAPDNVAFAAKSLVEHVENTVTKARADIEAMAAAANRGERLAIDAEARPALSETSEG